MAHFSKPKVLCIFIFELSTAASPNSRGGELIHLTAKAYAAASSSPRTNHPPPRPSRTSSQVTMLDAGLFPNRTWTCQTSTSTRPCPRGIRRDSSHQATRSNQRTGSTTKRHSRPPRTTTAGVPGLRSGMYICSMERTVGGCPDIKGPWRGTGTKKPRDPGLAAWITGFCLVGPTGIEPMTSTV